MVTVMVRDLRHRINWVDNAHAGRCQAVKQQAGHYQVFDAASIERKIRSFNKK